jgi:gamma-glutamylcyclotransferase (GGCT)/AIG2-like uncharacterized protein YtfP
MLVFGYGTLRDDLYPEGGELRFVGPATIKGDLWVIDSGRGSRVWAGVTAGDGEVFGHLFEGPDELIVPLDHREACIYGDEARSLYHRELVEVNMGEAEVAHEAWCYMTAGRAKLLERVESGNWDDRPKWLTAMGLRK